jgi:hypothetical protein
MVIFSVKYMVKVRDRVRVRFTVCVIVSVGLSSVLGVVLR